MGRKRGSYEKAFSHTGAIVFHGAARMDCDYHSLHGAGLGPVRPDNWGIRIVFRTIRGY